MLARDSRFSSPTVLLLGLVSLLLWGQCRLLDGHEQTPFPRHSLRVVRTDSLSPASSGSPPKLYLTLGVRNKEGTPLRLLHLQGRLALRNHYWSEWPPRGYLDGIIIPAHTEKLFPLVLPLTSQRASDSDSLRGLKQALRQGSAHQARLWLQATISVYQHHHPSSNDPSRNVYLGPRGQDLPLPAMPARP